MNKFMNKLKILKLSDSVALFFKNPVSERDQQFEGVSGLNFSISPSELQKLLSCKWNKFKRSEEQKNKRVLTTHHT